MVGRTHELLIRCRLNKYDMNKVMEAAHMMRDGVEKFLIY